MPEPEWDRRKRLGLRHMDQIDDTHPPTALRAALVRERPHREPAVVLDDSRSVLIDRELARLAQRVADRIRSRLG